MAKQDAEDRGAQEGTGSSSSGAQQPQQENSVKKRKVEHQKEREDEKISADEPEKKDELEPGTPTKDAEMEAHEEETLEDIPRAGGDVRLPTPERDPAPKISEIRPSMTTTAWGRNPARRDD